MKNHFTNFNLLCCLLLMLFSFPSCEEPPYELGPSDYRMLDTLVQKEKVLLKEDLDSLCDLRYEQLVAHAKDSIMKVRQQEIKNKLGK